MAVWVTIVGDAGTYRLSGQTADKSGYPYAGRLLNAPAIENIAKSTDQGNPVRNLSFAIDNVNDDDSLFISTATEILWNKDVTVSVDGCSETWTGKIRSFELQGNKTLVIDAIDDTYALFKKPIPDETIRIADFSQVGTEGTNTTISIPLGGTTSSPVRVKGTLVDRVNFIYLLAVGEIQSIVSIEKDRKTFPLGSPAAYTVALGTAGQPTYPGYAYVKFAADPRDSAGRWPDVHALVTGMKLGAATEAQCRNPARILYYLLTTAASGACGWGLGVSAGDLDATSFNAAITACDSLGFKIDGVIDQRRAASVWIDQICRAMRGRFVKRNGKHTITVDADSASVKTYTTLNTILDSFGRGVYSDRKNRIVCDYRFDIADGRLLGSAVRDDASSQSSIGVNESRLELLLVSDHAAANKIADYLINVETYGEKRLQFRTLDVPVGGLKNDDVITVDLPGIGISSQTFRITNVTHKWFDSSTPEATVQCRSYDAAIFGNTAPPAEPTWPTPASILPGPESMQAPAAVSAISLSSDVSVQDADGSTSAFVYGTFSLGARTLFVTVELGLGISPAPTTWRTVAATSTGSFRVDGLAVGAPYTFRFTAHNTGGDATPVTATITATRDTTAPNAPSAVTAGVFFKTTRVEITRAVAVSNNLAGYAIFRGTTNNSAAATEIGVIATSPNEQKVAFLDGNTSYATTYYYWAKAISRAGIRSGFYPGVNDGAQAVTEQLTGSADIAARTITADRICAASITAAEITTDYLTALKFRTKATTGNGGAQGDGICFDTTAIKGFAAGSATPNFTLDATNGNITANAGTVGGWTLVATSLTGGNATLSNTGYGSFGTGNDIAVISAADATYRFWAGNAAGASAPFSVTKAGAIAASSGVVGGWTLGANSLTNTGGGNTIGMDATGANSFYAGPTGAPVFSVSRAGAVTATSGRIAGWTITPSSLCTTQGLLGDTKTSMLSAGVLCFGCTSDTNVCQCSCFSYAGLMSCYSNGLASPWVRIVPGDTYTVCICGHNTNGLCIGSALVGVCVYTGDWAFTSSGPYGGNGNGICIGGMGCFKTSVKADTCITAGTCVTAPVVWANSTLSGTSGGLSLWDGTPSYYGIAMRYNQTVSFGYVGGGEYNQILFHSSSGNRGWIFADNYTPRASIRASDGAATFGYVLSCYSIEAGTSIYAATSVTANTCVVANAGAYVAGYDLYTAKQVRAGGWYAGPWNGHAFEIGADSGTAWALSYDRTNNKYCPMTMEASTITLRAGGGSYNIIACANRNHLYDTSIYNTLFFVNTFPSTTLGAGYIQATTLCFQASTCLDSCTTMVARINCSSGIAGIFQACNSNTTNGAYASVSLCAGSCVGQIWLNNQNTTSGNGAGGLNIYAGGSPVSLFGGSSEVLRATSSCVCIYGTLGCTSTRSIKHDYTDISVLGGIRNLSVQAWRFRSGPQDWRVGPYAEDVAREWPWLTDGHTIHSMDGIALRGIQELDTRLTDELIAPSVMAGIALGAVVELDTRLTDEQAVSARCFDDQKSCILKLESRLAALEEKLNAA